ncbi:MAG TPA: DUF2163 domain-containing protein [Sphingomonadaceae bacterium]|nr:DUF2163 domain-containing protein [Sphingomonadaceae bacterium]
MNIASGEVTTLALCWRLVRRDGAALGFTTHDRDLAIGGLLYRAAPGMLPSAIAAGEGLEVGGLDVSGALTADAITADDLVAGRWDRARVRVFAVDWERPEAGQVALARGELGAVSVTGRRFEAELRGPTAVLDGPVCEATSPECRAQLGDARCRVDMAGRSLRARVTSCDGDGRVVLDGSRELERFRFGRLLWLSGRNSGVAGPVVEAGEGWLRLREPPPFAPEAGATVEIAQGCDKRLETCRDRFANTLNFRGEPHLPGNDLLTRYPGS